MPFTTNLTGVTQVDDSLITLWDQGIILSGQEQLVMDQFANIRGEMNAKTITFTKYSNLTLATSALAETDDVTSEAMSDTAASLTPAEHGNVVTTTKLAYFQTGGKVDTAAAELVGINMGQTQDKLAILALEAGSNVLTPADKAEASLLDSDVISVSLLEKAYTRLRTNNARKIGQTYVMVAHPHVISDLRDSTGTGSWLDVNKYAQPGQVLMGEIGMFKGFRVIENSNITINSNAGDGNVDTYHTLCFGLNALGKAVSREPGGVLTGPFDKLGRFLNLGWYGVLAYGIIDSDALYVLTTASSFGTN